MSYDTKFRLYTQMCIAYCHKEKEDQTSSKWPDEIVQLYEWKKTQEKNCNRIQFFIWCNQLIISKIRLLSMLIKTRLLSILTSFSFWTKLAGLKGKNTVILLLYVPPGIFWKIGTNITLASSNHNISKREASSSFICKSNKGKKMKVRHSHITSRQKRRGFYLNWSENQLKSCLLMRKHLY